MIEDLKFRDWLLGFLLADGSLSINNNIYYLSIELAAKDAEIIHKIKDKLKINSSIYVRTRDTNFKKDFSSINLKIKDQNLIKYLIQCGLPVGAKSETCDIPSSIVHYNDFWRGFTDGDGCLGLRKNGTKPFIGLVTKSPFMIKSYLNYLTQILNFKFICNANKRDGCYNMMVCLNNAVILSRILYYDNCFGLDRKIQLANIIKYWICRENLNNYKNRI